MLVNYSYDQSIVNNIWDRIKRYFPEYDIDIILDVGSRSKGEDNQLSDYDFQISGQSSKCIIKDDADINSDIQKITDYSIYKELSNIYKYPICSIDVHQKNNLIEECEKNLGIKIGMVFVDTKKQIFDLAFETPFSAFRTRWFLFTSNVVRDDKSIIPKLQRMIIADRMYHWFPTVELQLKRCLIHDKLDTLLNRITIEDDTGRMQIYLARWVVWYLNYIRFAVGTYALVKCGFYIYQRDDVLKFLFTNMPEINYSSLLNLYKIKSESSLEDYCTSLSLRDRNAIISELHTYMIELDELLQTIWKRLDELRPHNEINRRKENATKILQVSSNLITSPDFIIDELCKWSLEKSHAMIQEMG